MDEDALEEVIDEVYDNAVEVISDTDRFTLDESITIAEEVISRLTGLLRSMESDRSRLQGY